MSGERLLVVGLRNPGRDYLGTRHNVGAEVVELLAGDASFGRAPKRISAEIVEASIVDRPTVLALPNTFMNESGGPVAGLVKYFKVAPLDLMLVHDDIDLPFGKLRLHLGRGSGGHNGVGSVVRSLRSDELWRLKIGVGRPRGRKDPADHVLERFGARERSDVDLLVAEAADVVRTFASQGGDAARQAAGDATARLGIA